MKKLNGYPFFLFLLPVFFFLKGYTDHGFFLSLPKLIPAYLLISLTIVVLFFSLQKWLKQKNKAALLTFYCGVVYLFFGDIKSRFDYLPHIHSYFLFLPLLAFIPFLFGKLLKNRQHLLHTLFSYCNVLMILLCLTQCFLIFIGNKKSAAYALSPIKFDPCSISKGPSLHLVLWDGYPGFASLKTHFNYDNTALRNSFAKNKFFVCDSNHSNYFQTYVSVNSLLNLQYIPYLQHVPLNQYYTVLQHLKQIDENAVVQFFQNHQFHIDNNSIFRLAAQPPQAYSGTGDGVETKFKYSEEIHFNEVLHNRLQKDFLWRFLKGKCRWEYAYKKLVLQQHLYNVKALQHILQLKGGRAQFSYTHLMMPHDPYFTDQSGKLIDRDTAAKTSPEKLFMAYLQYTNTQIEAVCEHLLSVDPHAIIIIMSDHGYREYTADNELALKFDNLLAVRFPDSNYTEIKKMHSNVNLFRIILNQFYGQHFLMLPDSCIALDEAANKISTFTPRTN